MTPGTDDQRRKSHRKIYLPLSFSSNTAFDFIDYQPGMFATLRKLASVEKEEYRRSFVIPSQVRACGCV